MEIEVSSEIKEIIQYLPDRPLLRIDEVANFFQVTKRTVYNWYETEKLKGTNLNGTLRIYRKSVIEMIINGNGKKAKEETDEEIKIQQRKLNRKTGWVRGW